MYDIETPVLIVGGGGCGLATSIFLAHQGIPSVLVERHLNPSPMPKARYLNQRAMEIFRQHGMAESIYARSLPLKNMSKARWCTSLGGEGPYDRKVLYEMDVFGGGGQNKTYMKDSPCPSTIYPQVRLEPLMNDMARREKLSTLLFNHSFISLEQDKDGVTALVEKRDSGTQLRIRAQYVVGADGGKTIGAQVGVKLVGTPELMDMVTVYFRADMSKYLDDDETFAYWFANPEGDTASWGCGILGKLGPDCHDRHSEEWQFHFSFKSGDPAGYEEDKLVPRMAALMKIPDFDPKVVSVGHWIVQGVLADKYRFDRVLLAGDAVHRHTPTTGLGLNSAIQDAHNLAWKLALLLKGQGGDALLDSYEAERRPAAQRNVDWALFTFSNHQLTGAAIGIVPGDPERSSANFKALLSDSFDGESRRFRFREVMKAHSTEYQAHDLEIGILYENGALVPDGSPVMPRDPSGHRYVPTTQPGARLPHAWVERNGHRVSTLDLVPRDGFALIAGRADSPWLSAACHAADKLGISLTAIAVGEESGDDNACDSDGEWRDVRQVGKDGALLVRPDQIVAWRATDARLASADHIEAVLRTVLGNH